MDSGDEPQPIHQRGYVLLWNAFKLMTASFSPAERAAVFHPQRDRHLQAGRQAARERRLTFFGPPHPAERAGRHAHTLLYAASSDAPRGLFRNVTIVEQYHSTNLITPCSVSLE